MTYGFDQIKTKQSSTITLFLSQCKITKAGHSYLRVILKEEVDRS